MISKIKLNIKPQVLQGISFKITQWIEEEDKCFACSTKDRNCTQRKNLKRFDIFDET